MKSPRTQTHVTAALIGALALLTPVTEAGEIGHYAGGFLNIRDYFVPPPGVYAAVYNYFYRTDQLNDRNGDRVDSVTVNPGSGPGLTLGVEVNVNMYVVAPTVIWVTDIKSLGIKYGAFISPNLANASLQGSLSSVTGRGGSAEASAFDVGDLFVQPVWLGKTLEHWDFALAYGFYAPTGKYNTEFYSLPGGNSVKAESGDNIGFGFWTQQIQGAVAWYPWADKRLAITSVLTYEINGKKKDFDLTPGQVLTFNWGISQFLPLRKDKSLLLEVGPAGYSSWQITDDTGSGASNAGVRDQVHAVGGQLGLAYLPWHASLTFHGFYEFAAKDRFQGASFGVSLAKKF